LCDKNVEMGIGFIKNVHDFMLGGRTSRNANGRVPDVFYHFEHVLLSRAAYLRQRVLQLGGVLGLPLIDLSFGLALLAMLGDLACLIGTFAKIYSWQEVLHFFVNE
jgi:hypothetical protein